MKDDTIFIVTHGSEAIGSIGQLAHNVLRYTSDRPVEICTPDEYIQLRNEVANFDAIYIDSVLKLNPSVVAGNLVIVLWETDTVPPQFVGILNSAKAVITCGNWCRDVFINSGVQVPVHAFDLGIDTAIFNPASELLPEQFVFCCVGQNRAGDTRKNFETVIAAALIANKFDSRIKLRIKTSGTKLQVGSPDIQVIYDDLPPSKLAEFYQRSCAFVTASHGEGWGLCQLEAMACGCPVIAPYWGGLTNFLDRSLPNFIEVPFTEVHAPAPYNSGHWAAVQPYDLAAKMLEVVNNHRTYIEFGQQAAKTVMKFTIRRSFEQLRECLALYV